MTLLKSLFELLPYEGTEWPMEKRVAWLHAAEAVFQLLYKESSGDSSTAIYVRPYRRLAAPEILDAPGRGTRYFGNRPGNEEAQLAELFERALARAEDRDADPVDIKL